jgi:hypothetical protein
VNGLQYDKKEYLHLNFPHNIRIPFFPSPPYKSDSRPRLSEEDFRKERRVDSFEFKDKSDWL